MKKETWLAFSCPHCPSQDDEVIDWVKGWIEDYQPDTIVLLGDLHEADSASKWPSDYTWTLEDEFESANNLLTDIRTTAKPGTNLIFLPGNHDDNIQAIGRLPSKIRSLVDYRDHESEFKNKNWKIPVEYVFDKKRGVYRIGQVSFFHGWSHGVSSDEKQSLILGNPYGLTISGHTHRPIQITQIAKGTVKLPYWYCNAGTVRNIDDVPYMNRMDRSNWGHALVIGESDVVKSPRTYKAWEAEVVIKRMFNEF